jgi:phosphatidylserine decarboxylase
MTIDRAAWPFVAIEAVVGAVAAVWSPWTAIPLALAAAFTLWFFRDPERVPPSEVGTLVAPADGRILTAGPDRISVFMNVFSVHVVRTPVAGSVREIRHTSGRFVAAFRDDAPEHNERAAITMARGGLEVRFTLIAGLIARRIVCRVSAGQHLRMGERVGLIRFGSRVDVELPPGSLAAVGVGDRVRAGETVIARLADSAGGNPPLERGDRPPREGPV